MNAAEPEASTFLALLEQSARDHRQLPAIRDSSTTLTYGELDELSARIAAAVSKHAFERPAPVALLMSHGAPLLAAMLGVVRSGCFYIVLNPLHPPDRLLEILGTVKPAATITDAEHLAAATALRPACRVLIPFDEAAREPASFTRPVEPAAATPLAIFHTSGSSGRAKALVWTHGATLHNVQNHAAALGITSADRLSLFSPCWAAASTSSLFGALLRGACVFPWNPVLSGFHVMERWIEEMGITVYHSVPSLFRRFTDSLPRDKKVGSIRAVKLGGEPLFAEDLARFRRHFLPGTLLVNGLGLTEANGNVCHFQAESGEAVLTRTVPVGKALDGVEIRLLDESGSEVEPGVAGEIALRGPYLSPGAWNGAGLEPLQLSNGWLQTGDLARRDAQGIYEHLGRKDGQLKLRGLWISPSEVEAALLQIPGIAEAGAVAIDTGEQEKSLVAFVSWYSGALPPAELRAEIRQRLPAHLVPRECLTLASLPLLPSGKIDRARLAGEARDTLAAAVQTRECGDEDTHESGDDPLELQLIRIWEKALRVGNIKARDDFFLLGGDSLMAATIFAAIHDFFGVDLPISSLLRAATVEKLAAVIRAGGWRPETQALWALQLRGGKPPLYAVPGAGCDALSFRALALRLGVYQPFFAFQPQGMTGGQPCLRSVEDAAARNIAVLRQRQPRGPYYLCGASFGGAVAFEMARSLIAAGESVPFLGLLDSYAGVYPRARRPLSPRRFARLGMHRLVRLRENEKVTGAHYMAALRVLLLEKPRLWYVRLLLRLPSLPRSQRLRRIFLQEACFKARRDYTLRPFPGKMHLFRVADGVPSDLFESDPLLGWAGMAQHGIEVQVVPGCHGNHLCEPHVAILAAKLSEALDAATPSPGSPTTPG